MEVFFFLLLLLAWPSGGSFTPVLNLASFGGEGGEKGNPLDKSRSSWP